MGVHSDGIGKGTTVYFDLPIYSNPSSTRSSLMTRSITGELLQEKSSKLPSFKNLFRWSSISAGGTISESFSPKVGKSNSIAAAYRLDVESTPVTTTTTDTNSHSYLFSGGRSTEMPSGTKDSSSLNFTPVRLFHESSSPGPSALLFSS